MSLADAGLHSTMEALAAKGIPPPDVGLELAGPEGEVAAEAELAWEAARGAVLLSPEAHQPFAEAGWRTFAADATDLTEAILNWWMESHP